jgi:calcineurin-like phosphoesterase family protein
VDVKHWFTSDTHFGHTNIVQYCDRPFRLADPSLCKRCGFGRPDWRDSHGAACCHPDIVAHDEALIANWNERVAPDDVVHHLGDFALTSLPAIAAIMARLNGTKYLITGNHDRHSNAAYRSVGFKQVGQSAPLNLGTVRILMKHNPRHIDNLKNYDLGLCGHVHEHYRETVLRQTDWGVESVKRIINVGVDVWSYRPVSLEELLAGGP